MLTTCCGNLDLHWLPKWIIYRCIFNNYSLKVLLKSNQWYMRCFANWHIGWAPTVKATVWGKDLAKWVAVGICIMNDSRWFVVCSSHLALGWVQNVIIYRTTAKIIISWKMEQNLSSGLWERFGHRNRHKYRDDKIYHLPTAGNNYINHQ